MNFTKDDLKKICQILGCSGMSSDCIGKPENCEIIRKCIYSRPDILELIEE